MTCTKPPGLHSQLDNGFLTAAYDCGVEGTIRSLDFASCGRVILKEPLVRKLMSFPGHDLTGKVATNPRDWVRAIRSDYVAARFKAVGLERPRVRLLDGVSIAEAHNDLNKGRLVTAAVWYGTLNRRAPRKSGSSTFNDNHAVSALVRNPDKEAGDSGLKLYDPLHDGRIVDSHRYPVGPVVLPWAVFRKMCGDVRVRTRNAQGQVVSERRLGWGLFLGITIARAKPLGGGGNGDGTDPGPTPTPETPEQVIARLTQELEKERAAHKTNLQFLLESVEDLNDTFTEKIDDLRDELQDDIDMIEAEGGEG
jgi:hypothetical protein